LPLSFLFFEREPKNFENFERERILLTMNANAQMCERVQKYAHMVYTAICTIDLEQKIIPPIIVENFMKYLSNPLECQNLKSRADNTLLTDTTSFSFMSVPKN